MKFPALLVLVQNPESDAYVGCNEELPRKDNDSLNLVVLDEFLPYLNCIAVVESTVGKEKTGNTSMLLT